MARVCSLAFCALAGLVACRSPEPTPPAVVAAPAPRPSVYPPAKLDLRRFMTPVKSQSDRSSCTYFAVAAVVEAKIKRQTGVEIDISEESMIFASKSEGHGADTEETSIVAAIEVLRGGALGEDEWPYQPSWFGAGLPCASFDVWNQRAPTECFAHRAPPASFARRSLGVTGRQILSSGETDPGSPERAERIAAILKAMADDETPLIVGLPLPPARGVDDPEGWPASGDMHYDASLAKKYPSVGSHFVPLVGYDTERRVFIFKNSWGPTWGHDGYGTVPFDVLMTHGGANGMGPVFFGVVVDAKKADVSARARAPSPKATEIIVKTTSKDGVVAVAVTGRVSGIARRHFAVAEQLVEKGSTRAGDKVVAQSAWHHLPTADDEVAWSSSSPLHLEIPPTKPQNATVLRVRIASHGDTGYVKLFEHDEPLPTP